MKWDWSFGDGTGASGPNVTHTYSSAGTYAVTLTVTDQCGVTKSKTRSVTVTSPGTTPPPSTPGTARTKANAGGSDGTAPGDPVSSANGELYFSTSDLSFGGIFPRLSFRRYYGSFLERDGYVTSALGTNWMHNFDLKLLAGSGTATIVYYGGKTIEFTRTGNEWRLKEPETIAFQLLEGDGHFHLFDPCTDLIYTFDYCQKLRLVTSRSIESLILTYSDDRLVEVVDEVGRWLRFTYTGDKLTRVQDQSGRFISFSYTGENLTGYTDARGNRTSYRYTESGGLAGLMTSLVQPEGNTPYRQEFDSKGRVSRQIDSTGNAVTFFYDTPTEGVTRMVDPFGSALHHTHLDSKYLTQETDEIGASTHYTYDTSNRRKTWTDRNGNTTSVSYHAPSGKIASYTDAAGNTTRFTYTLQYKDELDYYNLTRIDYPDGTFLTMTHHWSGLVESLTDRAGEVWSFTYTNRGEMLTATNPEGGVTTNTYNSDGTLATSAGPSGNTATYTYDPLKRLRRRTFADGTFQSYTYDAHDNILTVTNEKGGVTTFTYDRNDRPRTVTDALGKTITFAYDGNDRLASVVDRLGKTRSYTYDGLGRPQTFTNSAGELFTFGYSPQGWLQTATDPAGETTRLTYGNEGAVSSMSDPLQNVWEIGSNELGQTTQIVSPLSHSRSYSYDSMYRLTSYRDPSSALTRYNYNNLGDLSGMVLPDEVTASYTRNGLGLITSIRDPNGSLWNYAYDESGRMVKRTDPLNSETSHTYDERGRIAGGSHPLGSFQLTYDEVGNIVRRAYTDGTDLSYRFDANGRMVEADNLTLGYDARGDIIESNGISIIRDDAGRISLITYADGKNVIYEYNRRGLVSRVTDWIGGSTELDYDEAGRLTTLIRPNGIRTTFEYDADGHLVGRVEELAGILSSFSLTRNGVGQITSAVRNVPQIPDPIRTTDRFSYDTASQVSAFSYDRLGRLTADGTRTYTWDQASRLKRYSTGGTAVSFDYDGLDLRVRRSQGEIVQSYVWNYALGLPSISVIRQDGEDRQYYVHLPNGWLLHSIEADGTERRFYHFDEVGNTLFLSDDSGSPTDAYAYGPYGELLGWSGTSENPFTWQGQFGVMREGNGDFYYLRARYYDSQSGRFISRDLVQSLNPKEVSPYQYAAGNPMMYIDPLGMKASPKEKALQEIATTEIGEMLGWKNSRNIAGVAFGLSLLKDPIIWTNDGDLGKGGIQTVKQLADFREMSCYEFIHLAAWIAGDQKIIGSGLIPAITTTKSVLKSGDGVVWDRSSEIPFGKIVCGWNPKGDEQLRESLKQCKEFASGNFTHVAVSIGRGLVISNSQGNNISIQTVSECFPGYEEIRYGDYNWPSPAGE